LALNYPEYLIKNRVFGRFAHNFRTICPQVAKARREQNDAQSQISIDSNASTAYCLVMSTTLTIRNLDETVKQKLRLRAASHQRSMEAEAREILAASLAEDGPTETNRALAREQALQQEIAERRKRMQAVVGIWKDRYDGKSTDDIMKELRGDE
jgi:antitoxin FitA